MARVPIPELQRRLDRLRGDPVASGRLEVGAWAALADVGFRPVSEVMGAVTLMTTAAGFFGALRASYPLGWQGGPDEAPPVHLSSGRSSNRYGPARVRALRNGTRTAVARLVDEIRAVGGDGVVDLRVTRAARPDEGGVLTWDFLATGTAVRSTGRTHPARPFTSALTATETAVALRGGWAPVVFLYCPVAAARWVDPPSRRQERRRAANGEIVAYTETVTACRRRAVDDLAHDAARAGADGAVLGDLELTVGSDLTLAEASLELTGTALLRIPARDRGRVLPVLPVGASA